MCTSDVHNNNLAARAGNASINYPFVALQGSSSFALVRDAHLSLGCKAKLCELVCCLPCGRDLGLKHLVDLGKACRVHRAGMLEDFLSCRAPNTRVLAEYSKSGNV